MTEQTSVPRWLMMGLVAIVVLSGVWLAVGSPRDTPSTSDTSDTKEVMGEASDALTSRPRATQMTPTLNEPITRAPDYYIEKGGRLSLDAASLPDDGVVTFGLALDEEALGGGQDPLSAIVVSAGDGRRLELSATPVGGSRSGVRLEVDSAWFEPGLYMIQIRTAEKTALPLVRYVLEVRADLAPQTTP